MKRILKPFYTIIILCALCAVLFGPISWVDSASFHRTYQAFANYSVPTSGFVNQKTSKCAFRASTFYVTIRYFNEQKQELFQEIEIQAPLWEFLEQGQEVQLWYNPQMEDVVKIKMENEPRFLPPILKKGMGMWLTILGALLILLQIVFKYRIREYFSKKSV